ncbi:MAG: DUF5329 domain-containing protein [Deltaproteobacteria bacterium]|nr:DUF5329 domain-containing protein [Deltaproteobacteria bacterium]
MVLFVGIVFYSSALRADMGSEIDHLLNYIETSGCTFIRNGKSHSSRDAGEHIRKKYSYTKRRVKTTEDFIRYAATESSLSGRPYEVVCDGTEKATAEWLVEELIRFRKKTR